MKFIVGYPIKENKGFLDEIVQNKDSIAEVYFSWGDLPNGRSALDTDGELTGFALQKRQFEDLKRLLNYNIDSNGYRR